MVKKALVSFLIFLLLWIISLAWVVSTPSVLIRVVNGFFLPDQLKVTCLNYQISHISAVPLEQVCVEDNGLKVTASGLLYRPFEHTLLAQEIHITLNGNEAQTPKTAQDTQSNFSLPDGLPEITVNKVMIENALLASPIEFALKQHNKQTFEIHPVNHSALNLVEGGKIVFANDMIKGKIRWLPKSALSLLSLPAELKQLITLDEALVISELELTDSGISSRHQINQHVSLTSNRCEVQLLPAGVLDLDYHFDDHSGDLGLSDFTITINPDACQQARLLFSKAKDRRLTLAFDSGAKLQQQSIFLRETSLSSHSSGLLNAQFASVELTAGQPVHLKGVLTTELPDIGLLKGEVDVVVDNTQFTSSARLSSQQIRFDNIAVNQADVLLESQFSLTDNISGQGQLTVKTQTVDAASLAIHALSSHLEFQLNADLQWHMTGQSQIGKLLAEDMLSTPVTAVHNVKGVLPDLSFSAEHQVNLSSHLALVVAQQYNETHHTADITLPTQSAINLNPILSRFGPQLTAGEMSANIKLGLSDMSGEGKIEMQGVAVKYGEYQASGIRFSPLFTINSAELQITPSKFDINNLDAGVHITNMTGTLSTVEQRYNISDLNADMLGGSLQLGSAWLDRGDQTVTLKLRDIDLQDVMQTQQDAGINSSGIELSGKLNGDIPVKLKNGQASIALASLINSTEGTLKITGNSGFEALKAQQPEIGQQLALLEHVEFESLTSDLSMGTDGVVFFDMKIKGVNPQHQQPINFNYTHQQNIYTLLKALRLSEQIERNIQQKMTGDQ